MWDECAAMTTKALGQVLYEVYEGHGLPYCQLSDKDRERYEAEAQAVAAVVREQCAHACEKELDAARKNWRSIDRWSLIERIVVGCAQAIRTMK